MCVYHIAKNYQPLFEPIADLWTKIGLNLKETDNKVVALGNPSKLSEEQ